MSRLETAHDLIERWFRDALPVVHPTRAIEATIRLDGDELFIGERSVHLSQDARLIVLAIGKAAHAMAAGAHVVLGDRIDAGVMATKYGHGGEPIGGFEQIEAGHPVPDENSLRAGEALFDAVSGLGEQDVVLALISGGGSALVEKPMDGVSLDDMQRITKAVMNGGAGIHDLNRVRQALSEIKGGGLRRAMGPATCVSLLLSDVLGNDPHIIASGPTVLEDTSGPSAEAILQKYGVDATLPDPQTEAADPDTSCDIVEIIADSALLVDEIARLATIDGYQPEVAWTAYDGDADDLGRNIAEQLAATHADLLLGGGEATVHVRGSGKGGRNTQTALVAASTIPDGWVIASLASDGDDGLSDAAGAIVDATSRTRLADAGVDITVAINDNDAATALAASNDLLVTGPTGTNVNDIYIALRVREEESAR